MYLRSKGAICRYISRAPLSPSGGQSQFNSFSLIWRRTMAKIIDVFYYLFIQFSQYLLMMRHQVFVRMDSQFQLCSNASVQENTTNWVFLPIQFEEKSGYF